MPNEELDTPEFLMHVDLVEGVLPRIGREQWQTLYEIADVSPNRFGIWCAMLDTAAAAVAMEQDGWDHTIGDYRPGFSQCWEDGQQVATYHRFGGTEGVRPLVICRSFEGAFPDYIELDEEFRLYHNLAEDRERSLLLDFDDSGREIEVVRMKPKCVSARLKHLREFQAATGLHLAIYLDSSRRCRIHLDMIPTEKRHRVESVGSMRWSCHVGESPYGKEYVTLAHFIAKVLLPPPSREAAGIWPFCKSSERRCLSFIVATDGEGRDSEHTCDPDALSNFFGANPGAPNYLTPVHFRREVLEKYYAEPERYAITDGRLACLSKWSCQIDNDIDSGVIVFLGDLGRDLPYEEQLHWRQFNVPPNGMISATNFQRSFLAEFADAEAADLQFRDLYTRVSDDWTLVHGWALYLAPSKGDEYLLDTIRIPVTSSQPEFDQQVVNLTKLLVDSLNEKALTERAVVLPDNAKGITKLQGFLEGSGFADCEPFIAFLRDLQTLRSTGSAHRKGSSYKKALAKLQLDNASRQDAFRAILEQACEHLKQLRQHFCNRTSSG